MNPEVLEDLNVVTIDVLKGLSSGSVLAAGVTTNDAQGIEWSNDRQGDELLWIARVGGNNDWAIYANWHSEGEAKVMSAGEKITSKYQIRKLVHCTDEVLNRYRY